MNEIHVGNAIYAILRSGTPPTEYRYTVIGKCAYIRKTITTKTVIFKDSVGWQALPDQYEEKEELEYGIIISHDHPDCTYPFKNSTTVVKQSDIDRYKAQNRHQIQR